MKYVVVIIDGAAGLPLPGHGGRTCLELARTPNLDRLAGEGTLGLVRTVPEEMEPSSACACMSVLGYDPRVYYKGRAGIEAVSMGVAIGKDEVAFRCNLVAVRDGRMWDYSAGHISNEDAGELIAALNRDLGGAAVGFYPGVGYRHICKLKGRAALQARCTPPHDIPDRPVREYLPRGRGSRQLQQLMRRSEPVLAEHPVNRERVGRGEIPATSIWLFWGSGPAPSMPSFRQVYGLGAALTSGVDLLRGLARMAGMGVLEIAGVSDGPDNDYAAQAGGALGALEKNDLVVVHIEAPDEAAHAGSVADKVTAIERIDSEVIGRLCAAGSGLRALILPDHPTPIALRTHTAEPVPFLLWGEGFTGGGTGRFTEAEAAGTGIFMADGYKIMGRLISG